MNLQTIQYKSKQLTGYDSVWCKIIQCSDLLMTNTQFMEKRGVWKCVFLRDCLEVSYRSWDKSKNPCSCRNCTIWCINRTWKALDPWLHASQALMKHLVGKCAISAGAWVLAIFLFSDNWHNLPMKHELSR